MGRNPMRELESKDLKLIRQILGLSCKDLGEKLGVTKQTISNIETGRVEHGDYSNQTFKNVDYTFEYVPFYIKNIKLLPTSRKQYSASDLKKAYCTNCGKKLSPKFKYCPACGTKIN